MIEIFNYLKARYVSEKAQGIVEYALVLAFVVVLATALIRSSDISSSAANIFNNIANLLQNKQG